MSTGSASIPLLKAAPEPDQLEERMRGGPWRGLELCLAPRHVADDDAPARAAATASRHVPDGVVLTAEAPVAWPSGAFVRVDRLDAEARDGIRRSAEFAAAIGSPVLTIHLFAPATPEEFRRSHGLDDGEVERFLSFYAAACAERGVRPLIENVPPVLRMRTGGAFYTSVGGHWRDLRRWQERVPALGFTLDVSHAALFANFAAAYPGLFDLASDEELEAERFVEELGPRAEVAHVSDAAGLLGEGLPLGTGELELAPLVGRIGELVPYVVAEINEPDPGRSPSMKAGYAEIERLLAGDGAPGAARRRRSPADPFDWQAVLGRRDPVPDVLELEERLGGKRVLVTGGAGWVGRRLCSFLDGFRPERIVMLDAHEGSLARDRRERPSEQLMRLEHVLCDVRDADRLREEMTRAAPHVVFHLAAYKHVDWAERFPAEFVATNLEGSWSVLTAAEDAAAGTVVVASTDKAALAASRYGRTKRIMEALTAIVGGRGATQSAAVRLVNVLGSAGSASEIFLSQARAGVPLTVTDTGMLRYWITGAHAVALLAHGGLLAARGERLVTAADPVNVTVGELARRVWLAAGAPGDPALDVVGVRAGETMNEVLVGAGETLGPETYQGAAPILAPTAAGTLAAAAREAAALEAPEERRAVWLEALGVPARPAAARD
jgi:nucleoside-diphosphate-sugar epimerase/sugar phosphate isomerase/epimerase